MFSLLSIRLGVAAVVLAMVSYGTYSIRNAYTDRAALKVTVAAQQETLRLASKFREVDTKVITKRIQSIKYIKQKAASVQQEIARTPEVIYVSAPGCVLTGTWRVQHDAAATGTEIPATPGRVDAPAVTPKEAASTVAGNYETCLDNADRLQGLQDWIRGINK